MPPRRVEAGVGDSAQGEAGPLGSWRLLKGAPVGREKLECEQLGWAGLFQADLFSPIKWAPAADKRA